MLERREPPILRNSNSDAAREARARRTARRVGLRAKKSRSFRCTIDNYGGFTIMELTSNRILAGERLDMTAQDVIDFCADYR